MKKGILRKSLFIAITSLALLAACATAPAVDAAHRPARWATAVQVDGVDNLYRVDDHFYRSQQPTAEGLRRAREQLGIRTVIDLRAFHSDRDKAKQAGVRDEELSVKTWHIEDEDVVRVLSILRHRDNGPFLLHCQHGADRTGLMTAMYRIVEQGWSKDEAIDEMEHGGYGFHPVWGNIVRYIQNVDAGKIRKQLDTSPPAGQGP